MDQPPAGGAGGRGGGRGRNIDPRRNHGGGKGHVLGGGIARGRGAEGGRGQNRNNRRRGLQGNGLQNPPRGGLAAGNNQNGRNAHDQQVNEEDADVNMQANDDPAPERERRDKNRKPFERKGPAFGFKRLQNLLSTPTTDQVIISISLDSKEWEEFLKSANVKPSNPRNYLHLVMQLLAEKITGDTNQPTQQADICVPTIDENFQQCVREQCSQILMSSGSMPSRSNPRFDNSNSDFKDVDKSPESFLRNLATYCEFMVKKMPDLATDFLAGVVGTAFGVASSKLPDPVFSELRDSFQILINEMKLLVEKRDTKRNNAAKSSSRRDEFTEDEEKELHAMEAPEDFKELSIIPTCRELLSQQQVFLRPNKITGAYHDAQHYLDVQFRLLREDFVRPLKQGIQDFMKHRSDYLSKKKRIPLGTIRIYTEVQIVSVELVRDNTVYKVKLIEDNYKKIRWEKSKRLLTGSMLVFTSDFFKTAYFATVATRNVKELEKGIVSVMWEGDGPVWDREEAYLMVECEVYFEAYRHTLQTLQQLDLATFPMCKYIVEASSDVQPPKYLEIPTHLMKLELKNGEEKHFPPLAKDMWPSARDLGLDPNQFAAFQAAMTKNFAIIQGPPGTGKTYLGLKIAMTLLANEDIWASKVDTGPILVVCYTNHALDQFLEGIVENYKKTIGGEVPIVRVGGRCQSEILMEYTLPNVSRRKSHALMPKGFWPNKYEIMSEIDECRYRRNTVMDAMLALREIQGIVNFEKLLVWNELSIEYSTAVWKCFQTPSWFGLRDDLFSSSNFDEDKLVRSWFEIREVSKGDDVKKGIGTSHATQASFSGAKKPKNDALALEGEFSSDEDYDVEELLQDRVMDDIFAEVDSKQGHQLGAGILPYVAGLSVHNLDKAIIYLQSDIVQAQEDRKNPNPVPKITKLQEEMRILQNKRKFLDRLFTYYRTGRIDLPNVDDLITGLKASTIPDILLQRLPKNEKWALYLSIVQNARIHCAVRVAEASKELLKVQKKLRELQMLADRLVLQNSKVVGMTTTGAAKFNTHVQMMNSKIVIVEEAAEVLEAHIVTCISRSCEHLILIGDHRQLRPNPTVYELALKFNLNISLFERMIKNNLNCYQLKVQHRMRQEIADLVVGTIYQELHNDPVVLKYPPVMGVKKNLFFITHTELEKSESDSLSKSNLYEAKFLTGLCRYLILQGYGPERVTILTTYLGQMFSIKKLIGEVPSCRGVRVTCVDNYQGEENDIILLSLVRSNAACKIGFLNISNRICVAISRARHGLFIIGNMSLLSDKSNIWAQLQEKFEARNEIGSFLSLECQTHGTESRVQNDNDFKLHCPEGGCRLDCDALLKCSHRCPKVCHNNRDHETYDCKKPCLKYCFNDHPCRSQCFKKCPPCRVMIAKSLPQCGHEVEMHCYRQPSEHVCTIPMLKKLPCGHETDLPCHFNPADYVCKEKITKTLRCGHIRDLQCHVDIDTVTCKINVLKELPCGHKQNAECRFSPDVIKCLTKVEKILPACQHKMQVTCSESEKKAICMSPCSIRLPCGHACTKFCHITEDPNHLNYMCKKDCGKTCGEGHPCTSKHKCNTRCPPCINIMTRNLPCGHVKQNLPCHIDITNYDCLEPCDKNLECFHKCQNLCFQPCGPCNMIVKKRIHECGHIISIECEVRPTPDKCVVLVQPNNRSLCGHQVQVPCNIRRPADPTEIMAFCKNPCTYKFLEVDGGCGHQCKGNCSSCWQGRLHEKCQEKCGRTLPCGDVCNFPCAKACPPCKKTCQIKCEHSKCNSECGTPCTDCSEQCPWSCDHKTCKKLCRELCDRDPCDEPCTKKLACGHNCIGFCGEPCPPHCRICDKQHLTEFILYGNEDDDDARFVFLPDCNHSIEVEGLAYHMQLDEDEIGMKRCPRCQTVIRYCRRFNNLIRMRLDDVVNVKKKKFGNPQDLKVLQNELIQKLRWDEGQKWSRNFPNLHEYFLNSVVDIVPINVPSGSKGDRLLPKPVNKSKLKSINFFVGCVEDAIETLVKSRKVDGLKEELRVHLHNRYRELFLNVKNRELPLSPFEIRDIGRELERLFDLFQVFLRRSNPRFTDGHARAIPIYERALRIVNEPTSYNGLRKQELRGLLEQLEEILKTGLGISDMERKQIRQALAEKGEGSPGRWFKCRNGHYYMIGDCGGARVTARCPDCGDTIGGTNYSIQSGNQLAPEMDGATNSLWPNQIRH